MITVTGSLAFDHIMDFEGKFADYIMPDKIHQINLSFLVNTLKKQRGGTAGNIAYNLALLKIPVSILGIAGGDFLDYNQFLQDAGVDTSHIKIVDNDSSSNAFIMTDLLDNQISAFYPGVMSQANYLSLENLEPKLVVIAPNDPQAMINLTSQAKVQNIPIMLDPGMQLPRLEENSLSEMIEDVEILIGNDYEIELLKEKVGANTHQLLEEVKVLITTLGPKGSEIRSKDQIIQVDAGKPKEVVDPTGAGDAYRAGFLAGYIKKLDLKTCGQMGSTAACYAIENYGTTSHKFTIQEFQERYQDNFGEELEL